VSFLIDEHGVIEKVYDQVDPRDHPARVLADILGV
jgi:peroxiredoxin